MTKCTNFKSKFIETNLMRAGCDAKVLRINPHVKYTLVFAKIISSLHICTDAIKRETGALDVVLSFEHSELYLSLLFNTEGEE